MRIIKRKWLVLFSLISVTYTFSPLSTQLDPVVDKADGPDFIAANAGDAWVDSILDALTLEQKIGQLFMVAAYSNKDEKHKNEIAALIKDYQIGGLIFMQGGPVDKPNCVIIINRSVKFL